MNTDMTEMEQNSIFQLFCDGEPVSFETINTSRGTSDFREELDRIIKTLQIVSQYYHFSEAEKNAALMLYRCIKPLWFNKLQKLKEFQNDMDAIKEYLDETEHYLTETIDFSFYMI